MPNSDSGSAAFGQVVQIIGPVVDVEFEGKYLPPIYQALRITSEGFDVPTPVDVIAEVQQHLGEGRVRAVSMLPTDGMVRGMKALDTGGPISVPVGEGTLGRVLNVIGQPSAIRFIVTRPRSKSSPPNWKCSKPASRLSI